MTTRPADPTRRTDPPRPTRAARRARRPGACAALAALALGACGSPGEAPDPIETRVRPPGEYQSGRWTEAFLKPANLIADEVVIEGPPGLRAHLAVRQDSRGADYTAKATPKGFLQQVAARPEAGYVEIHATLDAWQIVAFRRLTWLELPADAPVVVRATGRATWQGVEGERRREDEVLEFRGVLER